jgi:hypothetical protein
MRGIQMMYGYKGKVAGMIIAGIGLILLIVQKLTHFIVFAKLNSDQHFNALLWFTMLGLFTIMFSKEKIEDERVQYLRTKSLMYAFCLMIAATMAFALTVTLMPTQDPEMAKGVTLSADDIIQAGRMMMFYPAVALVIYLVMFHIGLYFDDAWDYEDRPWSIRLLWKDKRYRLAILVGGLIIITVIYKLME